MTSFDPQQVMTQLPVVMDIFRGGPVPTTWRPGDLAFVRTKLTNTTGYRLENIILETQLIFGIFWPGPTLAEYYPCGDNWDGNGGLLPKLDVGETGIVAAALLKAIAPGSFWVALSVAGQVLSPSATGGYRYLTATVNP